MRIAVVSTGLGHVARGIEAWARELAINMANSETRGEGQETGQAVEVTLFGAAPLPSANFPVSNFKYQTISCLKRGSWVVRTWVKLAPDFTWRWGWKAAYSLEQKSFAKKLMPYLRTGEYDIIHTQDPVLALELEKARKAGKIDVPVVLAHGTDDSPEFLSEITYLQHLCLKYREKFEECYKNERIKFTEGNEVNKEREVKKSWVIPNFIDTKRFHPSDEKARNKKQGTGDKGNDLRAKLGIPEKALVVGCSAALQFSRKRLDYLIREMADYSHKVTKETKGETFLLLAGASTDQTPQVKALAEELLGDHCKVLENLPFDEMPDFFRALDIYIHPAYDEFYGISILEAMSSGLPVIAHSSPSLTEQVFAEKYLDVEVPVGGVSVDMKEQGSVTELLAELHEDEVVGLEGSIEKYGRQARERAEKLFAWEAVEPRFLRMYREVIMRSR